MDGGLTLCSVKELVDRREHWHRCASPVVTKSALKWIGDAQLFLTFFPCYKLREIERLLLGMARVSHAVLAHEPHGSGYTTRWVKLRLRLYLRPPAIN